MQAKKVRFFGSFVLVLGLAVMAVPVFGQGVAFQASSLPQQARFEGVSETMGAVVLQATGTGTIPSGSSITVVYSGTITNTPTIAALSGYFAGLSPSAGAAAGPCTGAGCLGDTNTIPNPTVATAAPTFTVTASGNQLTIQVSGGTTGTPATSQIGFKAGDYLVVSQIRVNVNSLGSSITTVSAQMSGTSSLPSSNPITFTNANVPVAAIVNPSLAVKLGSATNVSTCTIGAPAAVATGAGAALTGAGAGIFTVKVTENYPAALTSTADETGFTPTVLPAPANGSNVTIVVTGVPSGMSVNAPSPVANNTVATPAGNVPGGGANSNMVLTLSSGTALQTSTGGALTWTYAVTGDSTAVAESITLPFQIGVLSSGAFAAGSIPSIGTTVTPTATVSYAPIVSGSTPYTPVQFATNTEGSGTVATIGDCVTNLLFPFIANTVGFDTSVQITNTTADKLAFTSGNASPQSGTCTLSFYPTSDLSLATANTGVPSQATTPTIPAGGVYSFQQSGSSFKNQAGYLFAVCKFVDAHGFSWVGNASPALGTSAATISQGLLALVIPQAEIGAKRLGAFGPIAGVTYESLAH